MLRALTGNGMVVHVPFMGLPLVCRMFTFQPGWLFHVTVFSSQPSVSGWISYPPDEAVAFENKRRETELMVSPASMLVLNLSSALLTLADASRGFVVPKLVAGSEEST